MGTTVLRIDADGNSSFLGRNPPRPLVGVPSTLIPDASGELVLQPFQVVPVFPVPAQELAVTLGDRACLIRVFTKQIWVAQAQEIYTSQPDLAEINPIFLDLSIDDQLVLGGVPCLNRTRIVQNAYLGLTGDLAFIDMTGNEDPRVDGLGSRWLLTYWPDL